MKTQLFIFTALLILFFGCKSKDQSTQQPKDSVASTTLSKIETSNIATASKGSTEAKPVGAEKILGVWVAKGFDDPTFEIKKSTIYYFRTKDAVGYQILGDSIHINLDKDVEPHPTYLFTIKDKDTLILTTNDGFKSVAYRFKK